MYTTLSHPRPIRYWLISCMACVVGMVFIGGITRLTESGLSITEWKLFDGILPPFTAAQWEAYFSTYRESPEFLKINSLFAIDDFKKIFWLEYIHRLLGRITGLVFLLPWIAFTALRWLPVRLSIHMFTIGLLVAAQGLVGWVMVQSGLVDAPRVSPIKLAAHLSLALIVFSLTFTVYLRLFHSTVSAMKNSTLYYCSRGFIGLLFVQIILGALVAGWDAGLSYNTYPLMDGQWIPDGINMLSPWYQNVIDNRITIQFQHRIGGKLVVCLGIALVLLARRQETLKPLSIWLLSILCIQFALGIATLMMVVPITLASLHQLGAVLLLGMTLIFAHRTRPHSPAHPH